MLTVPTKWTQAIGGMANFKARAGNEFKMGLNTLSYQKATKDYWKNVKLSRQPEEVSPG